MPQSDNPEDANPGENQDDSKVPRGREYAFTRAKVMKVIGIKWPTKEKPSQ